MNKLTDIQVALLKALQKNGTRMCAQELAPSTDLLTDEVREEMDSLIEADLVVAHDARGMKFYQITGRGKYSLEHGHEYTKAPAGTARLAEPAEEQPLSRAARMARAVDTDAADDNGDPGDEHPTPALACDADRGVARTLNFPIAPQAPTPRPARAVATKVPAERLASIQAEIAEAIGKPTTEPAAEQPQATEAPAPAPAAAANPETGASPMKPKRKYTRKADATPGTNRQKILEAITRAPQTSGDLQALMGLSVLTVRKHVQALAAEGLVKQEHRRAPWTYVQAFMDSTQPPLPTTGTFSAKLPRKQLNGEKRPLAPRAAKVRAKAQGTGGAVVSPRRAVLSGKRDLYVNALGGMLIILVGVVAAFLLSLPVNATNVLVVWIGGFGVGWTLTDLVQWLRGRKVIDLVDLQTPVA